MKCHCGENFPKGMTLQPEKTIVSCVVCDRQYSVFEVTPGMIGLRLIDHKEASATQDSNKKNIHKDVNRTKFRMNRKVAIGFAAAVLLFAWFIKGINPTPSEIVFDGLFGGKVVVHKDEKVFVFAVATWCPHAQSLIKRLSEHPIPERVILVFGNEWDNMRAQAIHELKRSPDAVTKWIDDRREKADNISPELAKRIQDPAFIEQYILSTGIEIAFLNDTNTVPEFVPAALDYEWNWISLEAFYQKLKLRPAVDDSIAGR